MDRGEETAEGWLDSQSGEVSAWHQNIWELAEPAWREYKPARWYVDTLRLTATRSRRQRRHAEGVPRQLEEWGRQPPSDPDLCRVRRCRESPRDLGAGREEFLRRRQDVGNLPALLPADFTPPIEFRWPEYVTTARGREW